MKKIVLLVLFLLVISQAAYAQRGLGPALGGDPAKAKVNVVGSNEGGPISKEILERHKPGLSGEGSLRKEAKEWAKEDRQVLREKLKETVKEGNLEPKQARKLLERLREGVSEGKVDGAEFNKLRSRIEKAVVSGKLEAEDANKALEMVKDIDDEKEDESEEADDESDETEDDDAEESEDDEKLTGLDKAEVSGEGEKKGLERARAVASPEARELRKEAREQVREERKELREDRKVEREQVKEEYQRVKEVHKETNERLKQVRADLQVCKSGEKTEEECKELRQKVVDNSKEVLTSSNEKIRALIAQAQERIQNSNLPEERKTSLLEKLNERLTKLDKLAQRARSSEATKETVSEAARLLRQSWLEAKRDLRVSVNKVAANKLRNVIEKTQHVKTNLERMIAKLRERGKNTEGLETALKNFEERMAKAKTTYEEADALLEENKDDSSVDNGAELVKVSHEELKGAHEDLKTLVKDIKEQGDANE